MLQAFSNWLSGGNHPTPGNRKYVDLIYRETSLYATYRPFAASKIEVGDFGELDKDTGEFVYRGNIYKHDTILATLPELKQESYQPVQGTSIDDWIICSRVAKQTDLSVSPQANLAGLAEFSINLEVTFKDEKRGAYLVMKRPRMTELPKEILLEKLSRIPELQKSGTCLVAAVFSCPAYALEISDKTGKRACVRFCGQIPIPNVPGVMAGGGLGFGWKSEYAGASHQDACDKNGEDIYRPLYCLKQVRQPSKYRQPKAAVTGDDKWTNVPAPWAELDEDGNEILLDDDED